MFTCKQVSNALSREDYEKLPPLKRFFLKLHIKLCVFCGKFNRQVMDSQDMCRHFKTHEEELFSNRPSMNEDKKSELKALLAEQCSGNHSDSESKKAS